MKREEKVQLIIKTAKQQRLNIGTLTFLLAMTPDKGLTGLYNQIRVFANNDVIRFTKKIQLPKINRGERVFIIPNSEYRINFHKKRGKKELISLTGMFQTKTSFFGPTLNLTHVVFFFRVDEFRPMKKFIK